MLVVIEYINEYGFPVVAVVGMGWFIWFIYNYITEKIASKLDKAKINTVIELKDLQDKKVEKKDEKPK